ncbi:MAG: TIGR02996 domain-containing protein [Nannocystaceae bacterium]
MTDDTEPLQAVLDAPDDDAPRLAYAAWCDGQGEVVSSARAELIRDQITLAGMDPADLKAGRGFRLERRIEQGLERHHAAWAQPLLGWVRAAHFQRGFVGWIHLSARQWLDHGAQILAHAPVQHLDLVGIRDVDEALFESPSWAGIRSLSMNDCGLHDVHLQMLAASPHVTELRWLSVADNHLGQTASEALAKSSTLHRLGFVELGSNPFDPVEQEGVDGGVVVASSMPPEGKDLEARFGYQRWLHRGRGAGRFAVDQATTQSP